jgi:hypothetical protein
VAARDFTCLPDLAAALKAAGCTDAEVWGHLRGPGPHAEGCKRRGAVVLQPGREASEDQVVVSAELFAALSRLALHFGYRLDSHLSALEGKLAAEALRQGRQAVHGAEPARWPAFAGEPSEVCPGCRFATVL